MQIPEGETENRMLSLEPYLQVTIKDGDQVYYQEYQKEFTTLFKNINNLSVVPDTKALVVQKTSFEMVIMKK